MIIRRIIKRILAKEIRYLIRHGYSWTDDFTKLIKKETMETTTVQHLHDSFSLLINTYGFKKQKEINDSRGYYSIEYYSPDMTLKIESYRRELYLTLYKNSIPNLEIEIFNLLNYLYRNSENFFQAEFFRHEKNIEESYRKQIEYSSRVLALNFDTIVNFFRDQNYEKEAANLREYLLKKNPDLFKSQAPK
jgi:hypothetical protein